MRYAEEANYFQTTVQPAISQGEMSAMLEDFGAEGIMVATSQANGRYGMMIRFQWQGRTYRFSFTPLECKNPEKMYTIGGKKRTALDQSRYQMGRISAAFVKAVLTAAEATPDALFGFLELPAGRKGEMPPTAAELDVSGLTGLLPEFKTKQFGSGIIEGEVS